MSLNLHKVRQQKLNNNNSIKIIPLKFLHLFTDTYRRIGK